MRCSKPRNQSSQAQEREVGQPSQALQALEPASEHQPASASSDLLCAALAAPQQFGPADALVRLAGAVQSVDSSLLLYVIRAVLIRWRGRTFMQVILLFHSLILPEGGQFCRCGSIATGFAE